MQPASTLTVEEQLSVFGRSVPSLTPAQQSVADDLANSVAVAEVAVLSVAAGMGRTTVLEWVHARNGGTFIVARQFLKLSRKVAPADLEETFLEVLSEAVKSSETIFVDDLHLLMDVLKDCNDAVTEAVLDEAANQGKKIVFAVRGAVEPSAIRQRAVIWEMEGFLAKDYAWIAQYYLGNDASLLDMEKVHCFAPALTACQIKHACLWLGLRYAAPDTESLIDYLRLYLSAS